MAEWPAGRPYKASTQRSRGRRRRASIEHSRTSHFFDDRRTFMARVADKGRGHDGPLHGLTRIQCGGHVDKDPGSRSINRTQVGARPCECVQDIYDARLFRKGNVNYGWGRRNRRRREDAPQGI